MWFSAKTTVRYNIVTKPSAAAIEERIVLFLAADFDDALSVAEAEARAYAEGIDWLNAEGLRVTGEYLGCCDVFQLDGGPQDRAEVYSATVLDRSGSDRQQVIERFFGPARHDAVDAEMQMFEPDFEQTLHSRETQK